MVRLWVAVVVLAGLFPICCPADWKSEGDVRTKWGNLHYRTAGSGQPLLLLHGYFGQGGQWQKYLEAFSSDFTLIAVDLPGHGKSTNLADGFDTNKAASSMWELLDQLGYGKVSAIGYSAGGMTLLAMAIQQPERLRAMVVSASAHQAAGSPGPGNWEDLPPAFQADMLRNHPGGIPQIKKLIANHDIPQVDLKRLSGTGVPTLFVVGDRDEAFPLETVLKTYRVMEHAKLWVFPGIGHELFWSEWGGSKELEREFPIKVREFFVRGPQDRLELP